MLELIILFTLMYVISWVFYSKYQFIERDYSPKLDISKSASKKWHFWKGVNQIAFFGIIFSSTTLLLTVLLGIWYWVLFDILINVIALNKEAFYVGETSFIDKTIKKIGNFIHLSSSKLSFILKAVLLISSTILYFLY